MYIYMYFFFVTLFYSDPNLILGKWKIVELEAIEAIRNSDGYLLADFDTQTLADQQFQLAADEDREKASVRFVPRQMFIGSGT